MNLTAPILGVAFAVLGGAAAGATSLADGLWAGPHHGVIVKVEACGDALCGRIVTSASIAANPNVLDEHNQVAVLRSRRLKGLAIFYDLKGGPTEWRGGSIYNAKDGKVYRVLVKLNGPDSMTLTGCIVAFICQSQSWTRVKP